MNTVNCKQMTVGTWEFFYILLLSVTADELRVPRPHLQIVFAHAMYLWIYGSCKTNYKYTTEFVIALCTKLVHMPNGIFS